ncbi:aminotransferase class I/II-fold pyridoxal phosphate-dependent enzyme [Corynebacterium sp.]|uniref:aminotransferase class I/II-fold pyridoxal phosphate-dependent enzyme n=1 Tax=Corynebacterium sp. TaxID=1720 RepID=UPI0025C605BF|nr:aminotransferase class I/II-fold pyridoxal phosphate-dependent enzyme [Corynebacterium sp.]
MASEHHSPTHLLVRPASRVAGVGPTVFATITAEAVRTGAANLGQGFPDEDGPAEMLRRAAAEITGGNNQYGPGRGMPELRRAVAEDRRRRLGHQVDPEDVLVTVGATEGIAAAVLGLVDRGREVVVLEPTYDAYSAAIDLAEAVARPVRLLLDGGRWHLDRDRFAAAVADGPAAVILNSPHNPTGTVLGRDDLEFIADTLHGTGVVVISDEVYERLAFDRPHTAVATLPGMASRTVTLSSAAKSFNVTGWKTGWAIAPPALLDAVTAAKQFLSYVGVTPLQPAVAWALDNADDWSAGWSRTLRARRDRLADVLRATGQDVLHSDGTYFLVSDIAPMGLGLDAADFCRALPAAVGVAAIPVSSFVAGDDAQTSTLVRWTFCKDDTTLALAEERLRSADWTRLHKTGI